MHPALLIGSPQLHVQGIGPLPDLQGRHISPADRPEPLSRHHQFAYRPSVGQQTVQVCRQKGVDALLAPAAGDRPQKFPQPVLPAAFHLKSGRIVICTPCRDCLREMEEYVWDLRSGQKDQVKKEHDHAMDDMRYFVSTVLKQAQSGFSVGSVARRR